jgi:hypothetical protein
MVGDGRYECVLRDCNREKIDCYRVDIRYG